MHITRAKRRTVLVVPAVAMTLLLTACGGNAESGNAEDTTANGNETAASAPADTTESTTAPESTDTSEPPKARTARPPSRTPTASN